MDKQVTFPLLAIKQIANVMAIQNPSAPNYLKGPELVNLFNALGYLLEWKQLVKYIKELLFYASSSLQLNKFDVESAFMQEYSDLIEKKICTTAYREMI